MTKIQSVVWLETFTRKEKKVTFEKSQQLANLFFSFSCAEVQGFLCAWVYFVHFSVFDFLLDSHTCSELSNLLGLKFSPFLLVKVKREFQLEIYEIKGHNKQTNKKNKNHIARNINIEL